MSTRNTEAVSALACLLLRRRAREQQHQVGVFGAAGPDLLAVDDVVVAIAFGRGLQRRRVGAAGRLGDAERLQPQLAAGDLRQKPLLLVVVAMPQHRAHGVHLRVAGAGVAARAVDFLEDRAACADLEARAPIFLGDQHGEIAGIGQGLHEFGRISHRPIKLAPVLARKALAEPGDRVANVLMVVVGGVRLGTHGNVHGV
jgi:hypothetical protein